LTFTRQDSVSEIISLYYDVQGQNFHVQVACGSTKLALITHPSEGFYYLMRGSAELKETGSSFKVSMADSSIVVISPKTQHSLILGKDALLISLTWPSAPEEDCNVATPGEMPRLERESVYANFDENGELKMDDFGGGTENYSNSSSQ